MLAVQLLGPIGVARAEGAAGITGTVLDVDGHPVEGADVYTFQENSSGDDFGYADTSTNANGEYTIPTAELPSGTYTVFFQKDGYVRAARSGITVTSGEGVSGIDFTVGPGATLQGTVTDMLSGEPIANAYVYVSWSEGEGAGSAFTDSNGFYSVPNLKSGSVDVMVSKDDFFYSKRSIPVNAGEVTGGGDFQLEPGGFITGTVKDVNGQALEGIYVSAFNSDGQNAGDTTDSEGHYRLAPLRTGTYDTEVYDSHGDYLSVRNEGISVTAGQTTSDIDFALKLGGRIEGVIQDDQGRPIPGIHVDAQEQRGYGNYSAYTDNEGHYRIPGMNDGTYTVSTISDYTSETEGNVEISAANRSATVSFVLHVGGTITGTVLNADGTPIANANIYAYSYNPFRYKYATSSSDGTYTMKGLSNATYSMSVEAEGYVKQSGREVTIENYDSLEENYQLAPGATISGVVTDTAGQPLADVYVWLSDENGYSVSAYYSTDSEGRFELSDLPAGTYRVRANKDGYARPVSSELKLTTGAVLADVRLSMPREATISGKIADQHGDALLGNLYVLDDQGRGVDNLTTEWGLANSFKVYPLFPGTYTLKADYYSMSGPISQEKTVTVSEGENVLDTDFVFDTDSIGKTLGGYVTDAGGTKLAGATVKLMDVTQYPMMTTQTDANGYFAFHGISNGIFMVQASLGGYAAAISDYITIADGDQPESLALRLQQGTPGGGPNGGISDEDRVQQDYDALSKEAIRRANPDLDHVTDDLLLNAVGPNGSTITWTSSKPSFIKYTGALLSRPADGQPNETVELTAVVQSGEVSLSKTFTVTVLSLTLTDEQAVAQDEAALTADVIRGENPSLDGVTSDLNLPITGTNGSTISWSASGTGVDASNGHVTRAAFLTGDTHATLTAQIQRGTAPASSKSFDITIAKLPITDSESIYLAERNFNNGDILGDNSQLDAVTNNLLLPASGTEGTDIAWTSDRPDVIGTDGKVNRPTFTNGDARVLLTATFSKGDGEPKQRTIIILVQKKDITDEEAIAFAKNGLTADALKGDNADLSNVTKPLTLPATGAFDTEIAWTSSQPSALSDDGLTVVRPAFDASGDAVVTLTAHLTRGGKSDTKTFQARVKRETEGPLNVTVRDEQTQPVVNAIVMVKNGQNEQAATGYTDNDGIVRMNVPPGSYLVDVYANGFKPVEANAVVTATEHAKVAVSLQPSKLIEGRIETKQMTLQEIQDAGIDVNDSRNNNVFQFTAHLALKDPEQPQPSFYVNGYGDLVGGTGSSASAPLVLEDGRVAQPVAFPVPGHPEMQPSIAYLVMPAEVRTLKEFFKVELVLFSDMPSSFSLDEAKAKLELPAGLSLAELPIPQSSEIALGSIQGETEKHAEWIVRGDAPGEYPLTASFESYLNGFGDPIKVAAQFVTEHPLHIWGAGAYTVHIKVERQLETGIPYRVRYELENVSDNVIYGLHFAIRQPEDEEEPTYTLAYSGQLEPRTVDSLAPGEKAVFDYLFIPLVTKDIDLTHSFVTETGGGEQQAVDVEIIDSELFEQQ